MICLVKVKPDNAKKDDFSRNVICNMDMFLDTVPYSSSSPT